MFNDENRLVGPPKIKLCMFPIDHDMNKQNNKDTNNFPSSVYSSSDMVNRKGSERHNLKRLKNKLARPPLRRTQKSTRFSQISPLEHMETIGDDELKTLNCRKFPLKNLESSFERKKENCRTCETDFRKTIENENKQNKFTFIDSSKNIGTSTDNMPDYSYYNYTKDMEDDRMNRRPFSSEFYTSSPFTESTHLQPLNDVQTNDNKKMRRPSRTACGVRTYPELYQYSTFTDYSMNDLNSTDPFKRTIDNSGRRTFSFFSCFALKNNCCICLLAFLFFLSLFVGSTLFVTYYFKLNLFNVIHGTSKDQQNILQTNETFFDETYEAIKLAKSSSLVHFTNSTQIFNNNINITNSTNITGGITDIISRKWATTEIPKTSTIISIITTTIASILTTTVKPMTTTTPTKPMLTTTAIPMITTPPVTTIPTIISTILYNTSDIIKTTKLFKKTIPTIIKNGTSNTSTTLSTMQYMSSLVEEQERTTTLITKTTLKMSHTTTSTQFSGKLLKYNNIFHNTNNSATVSETTTDSLATHPNDHHEIERNKTIINDQFEENKNEKEKKYLLEIWKFFENFTLHLNQTDNQEMEEDTLNHFSNHLSTTSFKPNDTLPFTNVESGDILHTTSDNVQSTNNIRNNSRNPKILQNNYDNFINWTTPEPDIIQTIYPTEIFNISSTTTHNVTSKLMEEFFFQNATTQLQESITKFNDTDKYEKINHLMNSILPIIQGLSNFNRQTTTNSVSYYSTITSTSLRNLIKPEFDRNCENAISIFLIIKKVVEASDFDRTTNEKLMEKLRKIIFNELNCPSYFGANDLIKEIQKFSNNITSTTVESNMTGDIKGSTPTTEKRKKEATTTIVSIKINTTHNLNKVQETTSTFPAEIYQEYLTTKFSPHDKPLYSTSWYDEEFGIATTKVNFVRNNNFSNYKTSENNGNIIQNLFNMSTNNNVVSLTSSTTQTPKLFPYINTSYSTNAIKELETPETSQKLNDNFISRATLLKTTRNKDKPLKFTLPLSNSLFTMNYADNWTFPFTHKPNVSSKGFDGLSNTGKFENEFHDKHSKFYFNDSHLIDTTTFKPNNSETQRHSEWTLVNGNIFKNNYTTSYPHNAIKTTNNFSNHPIIKSSTLTSKFQKFSKVKDELKNITLNETKSSKTSNKLLSSKNSTDNNLSNGTSNKDVGRNLTIDNVTYITTTDSSTTIISEIENVTSVSILKEPTGNEDKLISTESIKDDNILKNVTDAKNIRDNVTVKIDLLNDKNVLTLEPFYINFLAHIFGVVSNNGTSFLSLLSPKRTFTNSFIKQFYSIFTKDSPTQDRQTNSTTFILNNSTLKSQKTSSPMKSSGNLLNEYNHSDHPWGKHEQLTPDSD
ncbi:hypothetical protein SNEBB_001937 [Seison nebaliae]|nr:hypothetical protein SNEBB_001937 [Seison nebaliae]